MHCGSTLDCTHWGRTYSLFWKCLRLYAYSWMHVHAHSQRLYESILLQKVMQVIDLLWNWPIFLLEIEKGCLILTCCFADVFVYFDIDYCIRSSNNPINRDAQKFMNKMLNYYSVCSLPFLQAKSLNIASADISLYSQEARQMSLHLTLNVTFCFYF